MTTSRRRVPKYSAGAAALGLVGRRAFARPKPIQIHDPVRRLPKSSPDATA